MADADVEVDVWESLCVRGKLVSFSSLGRFQDANGIKKDVTPRTDKYCSVGVGSKTFQFHDLMCTAFHGEKPSANHEAHHLDHKPENNRPDNLCWLSQERNKQESHNRTDRTRKPSGPQKSRKTLGRKFQSTDEWTEYPSIMAAAEALHLRPGNVSGVARGCCRQTGGYEFKFAEQPDLPGEVWKTLTVNTKKIQVSSLGRVVDSRGVKKAPVPSPTGYCRVMVKGKNYYVHRLVCEAFWGPPPAPGLQVDHKDGTKSNNHYLNLEWVTNAVNIKRSYLTNKNRRSNAPKRSKPVYARKHHTNDEWVEYPSLSEAARKLNLNPGSISAVTRGKQKQTGGWEFKLKPQK